jgi:large subunit ribosomal protein L17
MASYKGRKRKFHREAGQRGMLVRSLLLAMIENGKVRTTDARAREIRQRIEKLVTRARENTVANQRLVAARLGNNKTATAKLFKDIAPRFKDRKGGYTRVVKLPQTLRGNGAKESIVEFVA